VLQTAKREKDKAMSVRTISPSDVFANRHSEQAIKLIDVRTPSEFRSIHAEGATLVPLDQFDPGRLSRSDAAANNPIYLICGSGARAKTAAEKCAAAGLTNVAVVDGGTTAWEAAGLPVVRGRGAISLERQVRIAAGSLVFIGVVLGWFVHRIFFALPAFVGAGLVFSGVSNTCGMALVLARMPWNQADSAPDSGAPSTQSGS
jgi:rhodanese-related sulfurtransferase